MPENLSLPPLPPIPADQCLPYSAIRYIAGYPADFVHKYAQAYALAERMAERERCAKLCEDFQSSEYDPEKMSEEHGAQACARAIRSQE